MLAEKGFVEFPNLFKNHGLKLNIRRAAEHFPWYEIV